MSVAPLSFVRNMDKMKRFLCRESIQLRSDMKTIALATDLTPNANRVAYFAVQLARAQNADLLLVNAFHFWPANPAETGGNFPLTARALRQERQKALDKLAQTLHERHGHDTSIRAIVKEGYAIPSIQEVTQTEHVDLLVMSTVGSAPQSAQIMGSVASEMVTETNVPLLLVPPSINYTSLSNVVLALDLNTPPNAVVLDTALHMARQLGSVINVVCIHDDPTDPALTKRAEHVRSLMAAVPHTLTMMSGEEIYETLLSFTRTNKANLLMMLPQQHGWFRRLFMEGETQRMARLTDIPLLAIV